MKKIIICVSIVVFVFLGSIGGHKLVYKKDYNKIDKLDSEMVTFKKYIVEYEHDVKKNKELVDEHTKEQNAIVYKYKWERPTDLKGKELQDNYKVSIEKLDIVKKTYDKDKIERDRLKKKVKYFKFIREL